MRINKQEGALVYRQKDPREVLGPGSYFRPAARIIRHKRRGRLAWPDLDISILPEVKGASNHLQFVDVAEGQLCLVFEDKVYLEALSAGKYAYWKGLHEYSFVHVDMTQHFVQTELKRDWLRKPGVVEHIQVFTVQSFEKGALFVNRQFQKLLNPGDYAFWRCAETVEVTTCDLRKQQMEVAGQELLSKDKVTLRINFSCQFSVKDPAKVLTESAGPLQQLYQGIQLALREYTGGLTLDEILEYRERIGQAVLENVAHRAEELGYRLHSAGARDIILPGEVREIMNRVLLAEKQAQANLIQRREETASTRSLMNTAKLMENNPTLLKLKELESVEKILEKVPEIRLMNGSNLLDQLGELFMRKENR